MNTGQRVVQSIIIRKLSSSCVLPYLIIQHKTNQCRSSSAGFATAALTHLVETKGRDAYDNFQRERHLKEGNRLFFHDSF